MLIQTSQIKLPQGNRKAYPQAPSDNTEEELHGLKVPDPFRPLEKLNAPQTKAFIKAENALTEEYLGQIPERADFSKALNAINIETHAINQVEGNTLYYNKSVGKNHPLICQQEIGSSQERVLLDPNEFSQDGHISIDQWKVSPDGQSLAYGIRRNGTDEMEWRIRDLKTGEDYSEKLGNGRYGADDISWGSDSKGFYYTKYKQPLEGQAITQVVAYENQYYHELATPQTADQSADTPGLPDQDWSYKSVDGNSWSRLGDDAQGHNIVMAKGPMYPKGAILAWDDEHEEQTVVVPGGDHNLSDAAFAHNQVFANYLKDGHSHLVRFDREGNKLGEIDLPAMGTVSGMFEAPEGKLLYQFTSPTQPTTIYSLDVKTGVSSEYYKPATPFPSDRYVTRLIMSPSKDGTPVPVYVTHRKDLEMDGKRPTYLYAYGGFDVNETPAFDWTKLPWMDAGGVYATACLRGGGENGEQWHKDGMRLRKQNVFNDFIGAGETLIKEGITSPKNLGIGGGSNGGLLVAATELQRPDLFGAAIPEVGVHDMARFAKFTGGHHWIQEYGEVEKPNLFKNMMSYSPLHNVKDGVNYPATMIMTGDHDDRVTPSHSYKLAAEMQSAGNENPVLLRTQANIGHGFGMPRWMRIEENADKMAFLWQNLSAEKAG
ncbi:MAG: prolyl oligopeptidase family serine peptidase [Vulcanimicrobiota bacterium]